MKRGLLAFAFALVMPAVIVSTHSVASAVWYGSFWWDKDQNVYTIISVTNIGSVSEIVTVNFYNMGGTELTDYTTTVAAGATSVIYTASVPGGGIAATKGLIGSVTIVGSSGDELNLLLNGAVLVYKKSTMQAAIPLNWTWKYVPPQP